ncbi:acetyl-CoA synthetase-like protein [Xylariaceae sp. AK1471]|nr:acetyl-CoA synthetase-like protein [Xylariaceae sp. AK1471]
MGNNREDPTEIAELIRSHRVTVTLIMISEMSALLDYGSSILSLCSSWRISMCGGEAFIINLVRKFQKLDLPDLKLFNAYGPSETTIISSIGQVAYRTTKLADDHKVPVGPPIPNYGVYVLDETQQAAPLGWPGELCIAGPGVSPGYLGLPELVESKFKPDSIPKPGGFYDGWKTIYQTGDKAWMLAGGSFLYLGRIDEDTQVKLRGIRIELDEVTKSTLHTSEGVFSDAATILCSETNQILVAYVVFFHDKGAIYCVAAVLAI